MDQNTQPPETASSGRSRVRLAIVSTLAFAALSGVSALAYVSSSTPDAFARLIGTSHQLEFADSSTAIGLRGPDDAALDFTLVQAPPPDRARWFAALAECLENNDCPAQRADSSLAVLSAEARALWEGAPLPVDEPTEAMLTEADPAYSDPIAESAPADEAANPVVIARRVPLPVSRPPELHTAYRPDLARRGLAPDDLAGTRQRQAMAAAAPAGPVVDNRSAFERLFSSQAPAATPAMAYTALDNGAIRPQPQGGAISPSPTPPVVVAPRAGGGTAIYDISSKTVTMPNGERLEAHSGLAEKMDDPNYVHLRGKGSTPPGTYDLTYREKSFHGIQAIRMTPVGGSAAIHGRDGILAHHYLRGPSGESSGCVSFKDYNRFLNAYRRGQVSRIVVVTGAPQNPVTSFVSNLFGGS